MTDLPSIHKYLGKIIHRMNLDIQWRLIKGRIAMKHLHSIMWNMNITNNVTISFWQHNNLLCRKVKAMKIDFWQRCSSLTKMDSEPFACQTTIGGKPQNNGHYRIVMSKLLWVFKRNARRAMTFEDLSLGPNQS